LLTGKRPEGEIEPPSKRVQIDVRLDEIVLRALEKDPEMRYATAAEFRTRVETFAERKSAATEPKPPRGIQKFFQRVMPRHWFEAMRVESQDWFMICPCGHEVSVWDTGGIRFGAAGKPRRVMWCPACHQFRLFTTVWRGPTANTATPAAPSPPPAPVAPDRPKAIALCLTIFYLTLTWIALLTEVLALPGSRHLPLSAWAVIILPVTTLLGLYWAGRWRDRPERSYFRAFGWVAWILALPLLALSFFFLDDSWNPGADEAIIVPLIWFGAVAMPWSGWRLLRTGQTSTASPPASGPRVTIGCIIAALIMSFLLLIIPFAALLFYRATEAPRAEAQRAQARSDQQRIAAENARSQSLPGQASDHAGVGLALERHNDKFAVNLILPGSPAARIGTIMPGDVITAIGEGSGPMEDITGWKFETVVARLRGQEGSRVSLLINRSKDGRPNQLLTVNLIRQRLPILEADAAGQLNPNSPAIKRTLEPSTTPNVSPPPLKR
jgi:hypothetical protein